MIKERKKYHHQTFVMGVDLSYINAMRDHNATFSYQGVVTDPYLCFSKMGANTVRLRLWHNPKWQESLYGPVKYSDFQDVAKSLASSKSNGMATCLDLHYSDDWADPQKQGTPKAWENLPSQVVYDSIYQYTYNVLSKLKASNLLPEYIQIGNENNSGMVHPHGFIINNNFSKFASCVSAGIKACREVAPSTKIILHVAQLQNAPWWFEGITKAGIIDYDIMGVSHYDNWSNLHTMAEITEAIRSLKNTYSKDVMIVETAHPWTNESKDNYTNIIAASDIKSRYPITPDGQRDYMIALTQAVIDGGGKGVMYWEPGWISTPDFKDRWGTGSSWENNAFFDFSGQNLPVADYMTEVYKF
jgi:arabinogalactan endo-1,4-beta-galactosidase